MLMEKPPFFVVEIIIQENIKSLQYTFATLREYLHGWIFCIDYRYGLFAAGRVNIDNRIETA